MSVRTTTVVGTGLVALAFIGVASIFGESLSALVAPPPATDTAAAHATAASPSLPTGSAVTDRDGGATNAADGSS